jgi:hypothetical protein
MSARDERAAENESLFRSVNERLEQTALTWGTAEGGVEFLCECDDTDCLERLTLTVEEYESVRAHPAQFVVAPNHDAGDVEFVKRSNSRYAVVRKVGEAADVADAHDPRS